MKPICIFGDSIGKGVVLDAIRGRYILLKNSFINLFSLQTGIEVENFSKFGCTITTGKKIIEQKLDKLNSYAYTVLEFGGNDCDFDWAAISENPEENHLPKTELSKFESCYSDIINKVESNGSQPILLSLPPLDPQRYFSWISKNLNAVNILQWLGDVQHIYRWQEMYNLAVVRLAALKNVPILDIRSAFLQAKNYFNYLCEDGIHPNEAGHSLITEALHKYISEFSTSTSAFAFSV
ncbi:MAG TPA: hypothetical protein DIW17_11555 [Clostridiales bacterium]|nr:SGNH/GDSL hydrolase family protein [Clostridia bacterium]MDD4679359.1 SGNH/GDSL hydrolase family protein [Clostridia bacterium]HCS74494.1 hypothetical protein [Clostridiales bacterium]